MPYRWQDGTGRKNGAGKEAGGRGMRPERAGTGWPECGGEAGELTWDVKKSAPSESAFYTGRGFSRATCRKTRPRRLRKPCRAERVIPPLETMPR